MYAFQSIINFNKCITTTLKTYQFFPLPFKHILSMKILYHFFPLIFVPHSLQNFGLPIIVYPHSLQSFEFIFVVLFFKFTPQFLQKLASLSFTFPHFSHLTKFILSFQIYISSYIFPFITKFRISPSLIYFTYSSFFMYSKFI